MGRGKSASPGMSAANPGGKATNPQDSLRSSWGLNPLTTAMPTLIIRARALNNLNNRATTSDENTTLDALIAAEESGDTLTEQELVSNAVLLLAAGHITTTNLIGSGLQDKVAVIFDDMISTAGSVVGAVLVAKKNGAREIYACATHGVLCGEAISRLRDAPLKQIVITDTIPLTPEKQLPAIKVLSVAPLLADAIKRIHFNESVSKLFE